MKGARGWGVVREDVREGTGIEHDGDPPGDLHLPAEDLDPRLATRPDRHAEGCPAHRGHRGGGADLHRRARAEGPGQAVDHLPGQLLQGQVLRLPILAGGDALL